MKKKYQVISRHDRHALGRWLAKHGQGLLPLVELVESTELASQELIDVTGRASMEAVLELSAMQVAGEPHRALPTRFVTRSPQEPSESWHVRATVRFRTK